MTEEIKSTIVCGKGPVFYMGLFFDLDKQQTYAVLCDDLTGAMDAGLQMIDQEFQVTVLIDKDRIAKATRHSQVIMVDTNTRNIPAPEAYRTIQAYINALATYNIRLLYKKVDSTMRGNIGSEFDAILTENINSTIILAPSLPHYGRTVKNGILRVNGLPLLESDLAQDPFAGIMSSFIPEIIKAQSSVRVMMIKLKEIRKGPQNARQLLDTLTHRHGKIIVFDAVDDNDLAIISRTITSEMDGRILPQMTQERNTKGDPLAKDQCFLASGSAGLFRHLCRLCRGPAKAHPVSSGKERTTSNDYPLSSSMWGPRKRHQNRPILVVSGSSAAATKTQIKRAEMTGCRLFRIPGSSHQTHGQSPSFRKSNVSGCPHDRSTVDSVRSASKQIRLLDSEIRTALRGGVPVIIDGAGESKAAIEQLYRDNREALLRAGESVREQLAAITSMCLETGYIRALIIFGGDTAYAIMRSLGAWGITISGEAQPFIPAGYLRGGPYQGLPIVTKAGGFGQEDTLVKILRWMED